jgi:hypothetical protein
MGDHGRHIPISRYAYIEVFVGPRNYETRTETLEEELSTVTSRLEKKGAKVDLVRRTNAWLNGIPATRSRFRYRDAKMGHLMIEDHLIAVPMTGDHDAFVYTVYLVTPETSYSKNSIVFERLIHTWRFRSME